MAVILAAGVGSRMGRASLNRPKSLTPIGGRPVIDHTVGRLVDLGIDHIAVSTGHLGTDLARHCTSVWPAVDWEFIPNPRYATTNNLVSLWCTHHVVSRNVVLIEADVVVGPGGLDGLREPNAALLSPCTPWMNGSVATIDDGGMVVDIRDGTHLVPGDGCLKTVNAYSFTHQDWWNAIVPALAQRMESGDVNAYYEVAIDDALSHGDLALRAAVIDPEQWFEVDCPDDVDLATTFLKGWES